MTSMEFVAADRVGLGQTCRLDFVGVDGPALPGSGTTTNTATACAELCQSTPECFQWQWMYDEHTCWLKPASANLAPNDGSAAGQLNCSDAYHPVQILSLFGASTRRWFIVNAGAEEAKLSIPADAPRSAALLYAKTLADVSRQNLTEFANEDKILPSGIASLTIPPFAVAMLTP